METTRNISDYGGPGRPLNSVRAGEEQILSVFEEPKQRTAPKLFFSWKPLPPVSPRSGPKPRFNGAPEVIFPFKVYKEPETDDTHAESEKSQDKSSGGATVVVKYP